LQHQARATPRVENVEIVTAGVSLMYPIQHHAASRRVPPMGFLGPVEDLVCVKVQLAVFKQGGGRRHRPANLDGAVRGED
jgi:hypothetical protein